MTSENGGTYEGQYLCDGSVDDVKPTPSATDASRVHLLSTTGRYTECKRREMNVYIGKI